MSVNLRLRNCNNCDLQYIQKISNLVIKTKYSLNTFQDLLKKFPDFFIVAEVDQVIVGFVVCEVKRPKGIIYAMAVMPEFQRKGIGKMLMQELEYRLKIHKVREVYLHVRKSNLQAKKFYSMLGFDEVKTISAFYSDGEDAVEMHKIII